MNPGRFIRCAAAVGLLALGSTLLAAPGQAARADLSQAAVDEPAPPDEVGGDPGATPAPVDGAVAEVIGPVFIKTGTSPHPCLNAKQGGTANHTPIILYACYNTINNKWYLVRPTGANYWYIRTAGAGNRCLNAKQAGTANFTPIILYDCYATTNNIWFTYRPAGTSYHYIRTGGAGHRCLNVKGGGTANLTPIILYDCHATWNNVWYFVAAS